MDLSDARGRMILAGLVNFQASLRRHTTAR